MMTDDMTVYEARIIAYLRCNQEATFSYIGGLARGIWGDKAGAERLQGGVLGQTLVSKAEQVLGLEACALDNLVMEVGICLKCGCHEWMLCPANDAPKECSQCHQMSMVLPPITIKTNDEGENDEH